MPRTCLGTNKNKNINHLLITFIISTFCLLLSSIKITKITITPDYFYKFPPTFVTPVKLPDRRDGSEEPTVQWRPNAKEPLKTSSWEKTDQPEPLNISYWRKRPERKETNQKPDCKHRLIILNSPGQEGSTNNWTKSLFSTEKSYQQRIYWLLSTMQKIYLHIFHQTNTYWCMKLWCDWSCLGKESVKNAFGDLLTPKVLIIMLCDGSRMWGMASFCKLKTTIAIGDS